jgi:vancomycin resistance protein YoaR
MIGFGKSDFSGSINERIHNLILAASKFNGVLIAPNKVFSFNETVGDISSLSGYKPAYIIKDGKTILGDGGGVCQVSTTLFRAALNAGLPIVERHAHAYRVHYYENDSKPGLDATVFSPYVDLKIKNDTPAYILIQTEVDKKNNLLFFYLFGKKDQREVNLSPITVWDVVSPPEPKYQDDPTLKKGTIKQIEWAAWGAKSSFNYKVTKKGEIIFEKTFFSSYRPWPAVFLVGTAD